MTAKQVVFGDEARGKIVAGVSLLAQAVRGTLGPKARTVVLQRSFGPPGGENVYPIEIEGVISTLPEIAEVAAIPIDDAIYGQSPMVIFVPKSDVQISHRRILEHCKAHLVDYKIPVKIEQVDFIPKTSIGKPDKKALVQQYGISKK